VIVERPHLVKDFGFRLAIKSLTVKVYAGDDFSFLRTNPNQIKYRD